jgi:molybdopterin synthase sulfur carrier subunit
MNETGAVRLHVNVFVGDEEIKFTGGLSTPVPEGADLHVIPAVSGGAGVRARPKSVGAT